MMTLTELQSAFNQKLDGIAKEDLKDWLNNYKNTIDLSRAAESKIEKLYHDVDALPTISPDLAEILTCLALERIYPDDKVDFRINSTRFPDITIGNLGFEVKRTSSLANGMLGNSVLQENPGKQEIFVVLFEEKIEQGVTIKYYEDLIASIKVDHNPRFFLSINNEVNMFREFFQMNLKDFLSLSIEKKSRLLKEFLRDHRADSDMWLWYMGLRDSELLEIIMESVDEKWNQLDKKEIRTRIFAEMPEIISKVDYSSLRHFIVREYKCWGPVKDVFTAGRCASKEPYPKIFMHLLERLGDIKKHLLQGNYDIEQWKGDVTAYVTDKIGKSSNANGLSEKQAKEIIRKIKET